MKSELFIYHAMADKQVDVSQFYRLSGELQQADKKFQMMLYPEADGQFSDPALKSHLYQELNQFFTQPKVNHWNVLALIH